MRASFRKHTLKFNFPGGTSRGVLTEKDSWFISLWENDNPAVVGVGECSIIPRLSIDDVPELEEVIAQTVEVINNDNFQLSAFNFQPEDFPALRFALECAWIDLQNGGRQLLFPSPFTEGKAAIPINGLIWMGDFDSMWQLAEEKFKTGFRVLKMKVGALDFDEELYFVAQLRRNFPEIELRLDANGGFPPEEALERLLALAQYRIHSIEQPLKQGEIEKTALLCRKSPIAIALDEELIGIHLIAEKQKLLQYILPQYIILKPSLLGGFAASDEWISLAESLGIKWWATSALESNIGLNAIAQWTFIKNNPLPQGLGTGSVFGNNIPSLLIVENGSLMYKV
ncbi:MAG: o-succinylbenzoate synthase [Prevotellaceae bacterium]|jgi:o-succinylbenzoate synthase|nr:o-succinylbenzoate synthase [Prevotellaceae bacterium]